MPINQADTVWILISAALVMLMTPGLALFYGGMVRRKNILSTFMMSFVCLGLIGVLWVLYGYSLTFGADHGGFIGGLNFLGLHNVGKRPLPYMPLPCRSLLSWRSRRCSLSLPWRLSPARS